MNTILDKVTKDNIRMKPYPHVVIKDALPKDLADALLKDFPSLKHLSRGRQGLIKNGQIPNNLKVRYCGADVAQDKTLEDVWKKFIEAHLTGEFGMKFLDVFGQAIVESHPQLSDMINKADPDQIGVRKIDSFDDKEILLDAEICADTPVKKESSVRSAHIDSCDKLGVAMYYIRDEENNSVGGEFQVFRILKDNFVMNHIRNVKQRYLKNLEVVESVQYEHNTLVIFLNASDAFHGVSNRKPTNHIRKAFNFTLMVKDPIFDLSRYNENKWLRRFRSRALRLLGLNKEQLK
jgi:hypothetical protein